ncbi:MAG TPA: GGDEF domain-containing protein, partial [Aliarcobacter thereius]
MLNSELIIFLLIFSFSLTVVFFYLYIRTIIKARKSNKEVILKAKKEVEERLYKDELTGLKNRKALEDQIKDEESVIVILLDVDAFEDLNEIYGFINAEFVLSEIGKILKTFENSYDCTAFRMSGDIFAVSNINN